MDSDNMKERREKKSQKAGRQIFKLAQQNKYQDCGVTYDGKRDPEEAHVKDRKI